MSRPAILGFTVAASLLSARAFAAPSPVSLDTLPEGHLPKPAAPATTPKSIPATASVTGYVVKVQHRKMPKGFSEPVGVFSSKDQAEGYPNERSPGHGADVCMSNDFDTRPVEGVGPGEPVMWTSRLSPSVFLRGSRGGADVKPVETVHAERFVLSGGHASLETTDVWIDSRTLGVKLIGRATLPLALVTHGPFGSDVYAARDGSLVHFVVTPPVPSSGGESPFGWEEMSVLETNGTLTDAQGCRHARVTVSADDVGAQTAFLQATVTLPPPPGSPPVPENVERPEPKRMRPFRSILSVSRAKEDHTSLVSVSFGWAGKERRQ